MKSKSLNGAAICALLFLTSFFLVEGGRHYLNLMGLLIVISGTLGSTFLSYPFDELKAAVLVARNTYTRRVATAETIVDTLMTLSLKSRRAGILALQNEEHKTDVSFLRDALGMMVDRFGRRELSEILTNEMLHFRHRRERHERVFRHMARLAPAFGVAGSVIGLVGMLTGIGDTGVIVRTIPLALTSTLYGVVLSNFVLTPVAESIHSKTQRELLMHKLVLDGCVAILEEQNSHKLERKLKSFLTPSVRSAEALQGDAIRRRYFEATSAALTHDSAAE